MSIISCPGINLLRFGVSVAMKKPLIDQTEKTGAHLSLVSTIVKQAGVVKTATINPENDEEYSGFYADEANKLWPLNSVDDILQSATSIELQKSKMAKRLYTRVSDEVDDRAQLFNCGSQVYKIRNFIESQNQTHKAASEQKVEIVLDYNNEKVAFDVYDTSCIVKSADAFLKISDKLDWFTRKNIGQQFLKRAKELKYKLPDYLAIPLEQCSSQGVGSAMDVGRQMFARATKIASLNGQLAREIVKRASEFVKAAEKCGQTEYEEMLDNVIHLCDKVDKSYKLNEQYDESFQPTEKVAFKLSYSVINNINSTTTKVGNNLYLSHEIREVNAEKLNKIDPKLASRILNDTKTRIDLNKMRKEANTDVLNTVLKGFGINPVASGRTSDNARTASIRREDEIHQWLRVADGWGTDLVQKMDGSLEFTPGNMEDIPLGLVR